METCTLCEWENTNKEDDLVDWLNKNKIIGISLCAACRAELESDRA